MEPEMARRLGGTVALLQPESLYAALQQEMALFSDLRDKVFARYGLSHVPGLEQQIQGAIDRLWRTRPRRIRS
jgi:hypothetical protein